MAMALFLSFSCNCSSSHIITRITSFVNILSDSLIKWNFIRANLTSTLLHSPFNRTHGVTVDLKLALILDASLSTEYFLGLHLIPRVISDVMVYEPTNLWQNPYLLYLL